MYEESSIVRGSAVRGSLVRGSVVRSPVVTTIEVRSFSYGNTIRFRIFPATLVHLRASLAVSNSYSRIAFSLELFKATTFFSSVFCQLISGNKPGAR